MMIIQLVAKIFICPESGKHKCHIVQGVGASYLALRTVSMGGVGPARQQQHQRGSTVSPKQRICILIYEFTSNVLFPFFGEVHIPPPKTEHQR